MNESRIREVARFVGVGLINTGIDFSIFSIALFVANTSLVVANTIAYCVATANSYLMNKYWTFAGGSMTVVSTNEITRFLGFNLVGLALSNIVVVSLAKFVPVMMAKIGAIGVTFVWNYLTIRRFVFRG